MSAIPPTNVEKIPMDASVEARVLIQQIAGPALLGTPIKSMLSRVARVTGLGERRIRGLWNREARAIRCEEMAALRQAAERQRAVKTAQAEEAARHELRELRDRIAALETYLASADEDFHRHAIAALRGAAGVGPVDRCGSGRALD